MQPRTFELYKLACCHAYQASKHGCTFDEYKQALFALPHVGKDFEHHEPDSLGQRPIYLQAWIDAGGKA